jgi:hypothetical protein
MPRYLHKVHEIDVRVYRARQTCMSFRLIQLENRLTDLDEIWYGLYAIGVYSPTGWGRAPLVSRRPKERWRRGVTGGRCGATWVEAGIVWLHRWEQTPMWGTVPLAGWGPKERRRRGVSRDMLWYTAG